MLFAGWYVGGREKSDMIKFTLFTIDFFNNFPILFLESRKEVKIDFWHGFLLDHLLERITDPFCLHSSWV